MRYKTLKLATIGGFMALAGVSAFIFQDPAAAQSKPKTESRKKVLADVAAYKSWKLVSKPAPGSSTDTFRIADSSPGG